MKTHSKQGTETHRGWPWKRRRGYDKETKISREECAGRMHWCWSWDQGSHQPQTVALSLHLSLWGCLYSRLHCSLCCCSIFSVDQFSLLTRGFSAFPSLWLASGSHSDPLPTLPLTHLPLLTAEMAQFQFPGEKFHWPTLVRCPMPRPISSA